MKRRDNSSSLPINDFSEAIDNKKKKIERGREVENFNVYERV